MQDLFETNVMCRDILFYIFLGVATIGVSLFLGLGKEVTEKERNNLGNEVSNLLVERQGGTSICCLENVSVI